jgi:ribosome-associated toxin RatA of RatAB toxin-antitoxin module
MELKIGLGQAVGYGYNSVANIETYKEFTPWTGADEHRQHSKSG